jgi:hypothetical protein
MFGFYLFLATFPSSPLAPSSHEMRYNPFLGPVQLKIPKDKDMEGKKYGR